MNKLKLQRPHPISCGMDCLHYYIIVYLDIPIPILYLLRVHDVIILYCTSDLVYDVNCLCALQLYRQQTVQNKEVKLQFLMFLYSPIFTTNSRDGPIATEGWCHSKCAVAVCSSCCVLPPLSGAYSPYTCSQFCNSVRHDIPTGL